MEKAISFLGRDSGFGRKNTAAYAIVDNRLLLIDSGQTVMTELQNRSLLDPNLITGIDVIITHLHGDHAGSLSQLALWCYFVLKSPINIISACENIDTLMTITGAAENDQIPGFPEVRYTRINDFVNFIKTEHVGHELDCYGFSTTINDTPVVYTGDTTTIEPFLPFLGVGTQFYIDASINGGVHLKLEPNLPKLIELTQSSVAVYLMHLDNEQKIRDLIAGTAIKICDD